MPNGIAFRGSIVRLGSILPGLGILMNVDLTKTLN